MTNATISSNSTVEQPTVLFFSSSFCDPCTTARRTLDEVARLVPAVTYAELDVAREAEKAEQAGITSTPTIVIVSADGEEIFRAQGAPTLNQMLVALAKAV